MSASKSIKSHPLPSNLVFSCRECKIPVKGAHSLCESCFKSHPDCKGCKTRKVGRKSNSNEFYPYCAICRCFSIRCERASVESGYCEECLLEHKQAFKCRQCGEPKESANNPLCPSCFDKIPLCKCGTKVFYNFKTNRYGECCRNCRCHVPDCPNAHMREKSYCQACAKINCCTKCGGLKSRFNESDTCFKCTQEASYLPCPSGRNCGGLCKWKNDTEHYKYCNKCACLNRSCSNLSQPLGRYCLACDAKYGQKKCHSLSCIIPVYRNQLYCTRCEFEYKVNRRGPCLTRGCGNYVRFSKTYCAECLKNAIQHSNKGVSKSPLKTPSQDASSGILAAGTSSTNPPEISKKDKGFEKK